MSNQIFHYSETGISSGQRFYLKDDVSGIFLNRLNVNSDRSIQALNLVYNTGNQTISGNKTFIQDTTFGDSAQGDFLVISGNNFTVYGSGNFTSGLFVNSSPVLTGVNLSSYATKSLAIAYAIAL
jgi:hypothetical protein